MKITLVQIALASFTKPILCNEKEGDDPLDWLRNAIPGEPGRDYPILAGVKETSFSCLGLTFGGYYADPETSCQQYSVCLRNQGDTSKLTPVHFLCPNGTMFKQELFTCDWWFNVDCEASESLYGLAEGAFGTSGLSAGGAGACPAASPLSPAECAGSVSTCWSPGQRDTDCPGAGLCCYNGCSNICEEEGSQDSSLPAYGYGAPGRTAPTSSPPPPVYSPPPPSFSAPSLYSQSARSGRRLNQGSRKLSSTRSRKGEE